VLVVAGLVAAGTTVRIIDGVTLPPRCGITWAGEIGGLPTSAQPEPGAWQATRDVVTAPVSGLALAYAGGRGMELCDVGDRRLTVAFLPGANIPGGSTVGDVFVTGVRWDLSHEQATALARHESRHADQWTVLTLAGGPLALPVLYGSDESLFPSSKNVFEQLAGLRAGGYPPPANMDPSPMWSLVAVIVGLVLLLCWRRLRWVVRRTLGGAVAGARSAAGRCPLHTRGWVRPYC
jgi:hypothetical protein